MSNLRPELELISPATTSIRFRAANQLLRWREIVQAWESEAFATLFTNTLAQVPYKGFFWETPPLTQSAMDLPFECVVVESPALARQAADEAPFLEQLAQGSGDAMAFKNLGGDAELVVPRNVNLSADYAHLATFLRTASTHQAAALWRLVAERVRARLAAGQVFWLSTAGLGVAWLHVRLDATPKYYSHAAYRAVTRS